MNEGPPKKENNEVFPRFKTISREQLETLDDGGVHEHVLESNGIDTRECHEIVYYDESGEIKYVKELSRITHPRK